MERFDRLRRQHPRFIYHRFVVSPDEAALRFRFHFEIEPGIHFEPEVVIPDVDHQRISRLGPEVLNNLAFHLGMIESLSYWKATCSPEFVIEAGYLSPAQIDWWADLLLKGLGEFFFRNDIDFTLPDLVTFRLSRRRPDDAGRYDGQLAPARYLIPIGGGKDSAVSCELMKTSGGDLACWALNPIPAVSQVIEASSVPRSLTVRRTIDPALLELNAAGYLNGHTPFSAYLAFAASACAILFDYRSIAVSNERSSNEGNAWFLGAAVNHQYSKSFAFEQRFRSYATSYLAGDLDYFSLLRPLYELQIARIFARFPRYFPVFRSCNRGQKENIWCCSCPKCLFAYTILFPFLDDAALRAIFSERLFDRTELIDTAFDMIEPDAVKPFECVGSREETLIAFHLCVVKVRARGEQLPVVLQAVEDRILVREARLDERAEAIMTAWNAEHAVPDDLARLLRAEISR